MKSACGNWLDSEISFTKQTRGTERERGTTWSKGHIWNVKLFSQDVEKKCKPFKTNYWNNKMVVLPDNSPVRHLSVRIAKKSYTKIHGERESRFVSFACVRSPHGFGQLFHPKTLRCLIKPRALIWSRGLRLKRWCAREESVLQEMHFKCHVTNCSVIMMALARAWMLLECLLAVFCVLSIGGECDYSIFTIFSA